MTQLSSLAQQLQKLKVTQKDEIHLPDRTKVSFLFDIKQAANVDDQTLYYICLGGLRDIAQQLPELSKQLLIFQSDILSEKSLEFYRGTQTKDTIKTIDDQLTLLIKLLAPYFLNTSTHKILEYLIRVYEIHAFHKHLLIYSFLPYFETAFFLRMVQLLNIKQDELMFFMEPFAYSGDALDQKSLINGLARNNGTLFSKYADFCFNLSQLHMGISQNIENCLHWKFFGAMLVEILRSNKEDETLLFNVLPYISQGMNQPIQDLRTASLMGISQIVCRKNLTTEYSIAFFKQVLYFIAKNTVSDEDIEKGLLVLVLLTQFQRIDTLSATDFKVLSDLPRLNKHMKMTHESHDLTSFLIMIVKTLLIEAQTEIRDSIAQLKDCFNLKSIYTSIETVIAISINNGSDNHERCHQILVQLKSIHEQEFNQAIIFLLKQASLTEQQRDQIVTLLQGKDQKSHIISKFGDKEYSLLSSLASQSKITKLNALNALIRPEFSQKLSKNEKDLIKISLSQLITRNSEEESVIEKVLEAFVSLIDYSVINDSEFDTLEQFIGSNISQPRYSQSIIQSTIKILLNLKVSEKNERDNQQLMLGFCFDQIHSLYTKFSIGKSSSNSVVEFIKVAVKDFQLSSDFALNLIKCPKQWIKQAHVVELLQQILEKSTASQDQLNSFYLNVIQAIELSSRDNSSIVTILISKLKKSSISQDKLLSKLIGQCLVEKQKNRQFDMRGLLQVLFTQIMGTSQQKLAEFFMKLAIESKNEVKQVFAIISLTQIVKQKAITPQMFMATSLILLQSSSKQVRIQTINMIEAFNTLKDDGPELQVYNNTPKPQSSKKSTDKQSFTPLKVQPIQRLLKQLVHLKHEVIQDRQQTLTALNSSAHVGIIDSSVRFLLDFPSTKMKLQFILALKALNKYSIIFGMSLQEQLNKEYFTYKQVSQYTSLDNAYLTAIGQLIEKMAMQKSNDAQEEFISSLVFPYLQFLLGLNTTDILLEQQLTSLFEQNLLRRDILKSLKSEHVVTILKIYVQSQLSMHSKQSRQKIRDILVQQANFEQSNNVHVLSDKHVAPIIVDAKEKLSKTRNIDQSVINHLEVVLETLTQVRVSNEANIMEDILDIVMILGRRSNESSIYLIELCVQLCIQIIQGNQKIKGNTQKTLRLVNDLISSQMQTLKVQIDSILNSNDADVNDPFQQFIMQVETGNAQPVDSNQDEKLITIIQVISSICNLLLQFEINVLINSEETQKYLEELSQLFNTIINDSRSKSAKGRLLIVQIYRFYHQQVLRATKISAKKNVDVKLMLSTFIDSSLLEMGLNFDEVYKCIQSVTTETDLTSFVCLVLLTHGKDCVQVMDDLQLDSLEIQIVQKLFIENKHVLQLFEELLFLVASLQISESTESFIKQRFNIIFDTDLVSQRMEITSYVYNKYIKDPKESRKLKFLSVYLMNEWLSKNAIVQRHLSYATKENPEESNKYFYQIYLSSSVFNESVNHTLQSKEKEDEDKKVKKSLKRLYSRIQDFQRNLNNLLSYEVQVSIVIRVMTEFNDSKQTINMRTTTIQLLINKTPQFAQSLSKVQEKEMIIIFSPLIALTIKNLQAMLNQFTGKANTEKQNYIMALLSLLQRTASTLLNGESKDKIVKLVLGYSEHMHQLSMMVHSQLILTAMTLFEVHHLDLLEHLQTYFEMLVASFVRVQQHLECQDFFVDSFTKTLLKASLSLCAFFSKFMTAAQYESIIKNVIVITRASFTDDIKAVLDVISKESTKNVGFKLVFQAMLNSYDEVIISRISDEENASHDVSVIILRYFNDLFTQVIQRVKKEFIVENHHKIFDFFKDAFSITYTYQKAHGHVDMPNVIEVDESISHSYQQFVVKMNEDQLRPLIVKQTKWAFKSKDAEPENFPYNLHKSISFLRSMNALLNGLREFFVPLMPLYFDRIVNIISILGQQKEQENLKRKRQQIEFEADDKHCHTFYELLTLTIKNIQLNFLFDNVSFIQNDTFETISEPIAQLVTLTQIGSEYNNFLEDVLKPAVFDIVERINNDDMWKKINYDILMHTRNTSPQIRLGAFKIIEHLFNRIGERYLILLNDTIPFLSEGMEDENPDVEICAKAIVARIEQMTGDSIHEYLK